jgi:hypothetical protein
MALSPLIPAKLRGKQWRDLQSLSISEFFQNYGKILNFDPEYQREFGAWSLQAQSKLISNIFDLDMKLPKFYLQECPSIDENGKKYPFSIIDGKQRLMTILRFLDDQISITIKGVQYNWSGLDPKYQKIFNNTRLDFETLVEPDDIAIAVFIALQSGKPLPRVDIRHALIGDFRNVVLELSQRTGQSGSKHLECNIFGNNSMNKRKHEYYAGILFLATLYYFNENPNFKGAPLRWDLSDNALDLVYTHYYLNRNETVNKWIIKKFRSTMSKLEKSLNMYRGKVGSKPQLCIIKGIWLFILYLEEYYNLTIKEFDDIIQTVVVEAMEIMNNFNSDPRDAGYLGNFENTFWPWASGAKEALYWISDTSKGFKLFKDHFEYFLTKNKMLPKKKVLGATFSKVVKDEILEKAKNGNNQVVCKSCGVILTNQSQIQYDHIEPHSFGGQSVVSNGQILCKHCNQSKGNCSNNSAASNIAKTIARRSPSHIIQASSDIS